MIKVCDKNVCVFRHRFVNIRAALRRSDAFLSGTKIYNQLIVYLQTNILIVAEVKINGTKILQIQQCSKREETVELQLSVIQLRVVLIVRKFCQQKLQLLLKSVW